MTDYVIGPGVQAAMAEAGDEPRSDEQYLILAAGRQISQTFGRDAIYYWLQEDGVVRRCPFR
jgi:hypothetical protein